MTLRTITLTMTNEDWVIALQALAAAAGQSEPPADQAHAQRVYSTLRDGIFGQVLPPLDDDQG